jgi:uncharacterized protein YggE
MEGLVDEGINKIDNVVFQSKLERFQSEARKMAMKDAKQKAEDYVSVGQKVGKAITISDNSQNYYPQPMYETMRMAKMKARHQDKHSLLAEINIS